MSNSEKRENSFFSEPEGGETSVDQTIEQIINAGVTGKDIDTIAEQAAYSSLAGFSSDARASGQLAAAEGILERFENAVWGPPKGQVTIGGKSIGLTANRRTDDPALNPFDIYVAFGDYVADDRIHHTIQRLSNVYLLGQAKQIVIDGKPVQEAYSFLARDQV